MALLKIWMVSVYKTILQHALLYVHLHLNTPSWVIKTAANICLLYLFNVQSVFSPKIFPRRRFRLIHVFKVRATTSYYHRQNG